MPYILLINIYVFSIILYCVVYFLQIKLKCIQLSLKAVLKLTLIYIYISLAAHNELEGEYFFMLVANANNEIQRFYRLPPSVSSLLYTVRLHTIFFKVGQ